MRIKSFAPLMMAGLLAMPVAAQQLDPYEEESQPSQTEEQQQQDAAQDEDNSFDVDLEVEADVDTDRNDEELPQTASPLALLALIGTGGAGGAFFLRKLRRR